MLILFKKIVSYILKKIVKYMTEFITSSSSVQFTYVNYILIVCVTDLIFSSYETKTFSY